MNYNEENNNMDLTNNTIQTNIPSSINTQENTNNTNTLNNKLTFSKESKLIMILALTASLIILLDNFIMGLDWYWKLLFKASIADNKQLRNALEALSTLVDAFNLLIIIIILILSIIFEIRDKKKQKDITIFSWYIRICILSIIIGVKLTIFLYPFTTLIISITHKNSFINNRKIYLIFSIIVLIIVGFILVGDQLYLFDYLEDKFNEYKEIQANKAKESVEEDAYVITNFDSIISDWGTDVTKNKSFKIKNVKLDNITANLYIDYIYKTIGEDMISTIIIKHGDTDLYSYTDTTTNFKLSYLKLYKNLILYGISNCDEVIDGICKKHPTYTEILAFNKYDSISFYESIITFNKKIYTESSVFMEDERIYANPYNDFRVYDIKVKDNYIYFYTIAEKYDSLFKADKSKYEQCDNTYWITSTFDMQRVYKTSIVFNEKYKYNKLDNVTKQTSIKYSDYCKNENVLNILESN